MNRRATEVERNCVYIIPPGYDIEFRDGTLSLSEPTLTRGLRLPVDRLFISLAQALGRQAIGIVLSGTGGDGSLGACAIKNRGGMVMVQTPASSEYSDMPQNTLSTGAANFELPPSDMPTKLIEFVKSPFSKTVNSSIFWNFSNEHLLERIFILLKARTGHDFSLYKPSTIQRRIERRLAIHQIDTLDTYVKHLEQTPTELDQLFKDLLIGVTGFFRDPKSFIALEQLLFQKLFKNKQPGSQIRAWVVGCSTGEEAYSVAILLLEQMALLKQHFQLQIFASDINSEAIDTARKGIYSIDIANHVSKERLKRFFTLEPNGKGYRVGKELRNILIFSQHDINRDPPFSKLDLISCRNLLIYIDAEQQKRLVPIFHYALNSGGILLLGMSEHANNCDDLFYMVDHTAKIYQRRDDSGNLRKHPLPGFNYPKQALTSSNEKFTAPRKISMQELAEQTLLREVVPAAALVNAQGDILYLHGSTGKFLEPARGEARLNNILTMAREGLQFELKMALRKAVKAGKIQCVTDLQIETDNYSIGVKLTILPLSKDNDKSPESQLYLIVLVEAPLGLTSTSGVNTDTITHLKTQLHSKDGEIRHLIAELDCSIDEQKRANEEMQSVNEEMQSTNEELETSKEELQSVNEEMATTNVELQTSLSSLSRINNNINNLLFGTGIATVFVDPQLLIPPIQL